MGYELLDDDLTKSTLWMFGSKDAKLLFVTILSECRGSEICRVPVPVLFKLAGLTPAEGVEALVELCNPDPDSKCPAAGGARIVRVEDEHGKGLFLPSYRERRNRYMSKNRMADLRRREEEKKARDAALRSVTAGDAAFDLAAAAAAAAAAAPAAAPSPEQSGEAGEGGSTRGGASFVVPTREELLRLAEEDGYRDVRPEDADSFLEAYGRADQGVRLTADTWPLAWRLFHASTRGER